jgi:hypothetical protein
MGISMDYPSGHQTWHLMGTSSNSVGGSHDSFSEDKHQTWGWPWFSTFWTYHEYMMLIYGNMILNNGYFPLHITSPSKTRVSPTQMMVEWGRPAVSSHVAGSVNGEICSKPWLKTRGQRIWTTFLSDSIPSMAGFAGKSSSGINGMIFQYPYICRALFQGWYSEAIL